MRDAVQEFRTPLPPRQRKFKFGTTTFMLVMHVGAVFALLPRFWSWQAVVALAVLYWITVLGVTLGLHRLVTHRSFVAPKWVERILVLIGGPGLPKRTHRVGGPAPPSPQVFRPIQRSPRCWAGSVVGP